jgi:GxxExxY protein
VGEYSADLLVEDVLVVELECAECPANEHMAQCLNSLRVSGSTLRHLASFQKPQGEWRRIVLDFQIPDPLGATPAAG